MCRPLREQLILMCFACIVCIFPLGPFQRLAAQEATRPASDDDPRLDRARLIEKSEHDLAAAEAIYREVIGDPTASESTKTRARLCLGLCLLEQGKEDKANEALRAAADGEGPHAEEARAVLDGRAEAKQRLETTVKGLAGNIRVSQASDALQEIGDPAVPYVIEALQSTRDYHGAKALAKTLVYIASEQVVAFLESIVRSEDVYLQRLFLQSMTGNRRYIPHRDVVRVFLPLLNTADRATRRKIAGLACRALTTDEVLELIEHRDEYVRNRALSEIDHRRLLTDAQVVARVAPLLQRFIGTDDEDVLHGHLENEDILTTPPGKDLVLAALRGRVSISHNALRGMKASIQNGNFFSARDLAELCQELGPTTLRLERTINDLVESSSRFWKAGATAEFLSIVRSGYGDEDELVKWIVHNAGEDEYALVVENLDLYGGSLRYVLHWLKDRRATEEALPALERALANPELRGRLAQAQPRDPSLEDAIAFSGEELPTGVELLVSAIASIGTAEAADALVRLARLAPEDLEALAASKLLDGPPTFDGALVALLEVTRDSTLRHNTLRRLAERGVYDRTAIRQALERGIFYGDYFHFLFSAFEEDGECRYDQRQALEVVELALGSTYDRYLVEIARSLLFYGIERNIPRALVERLFDRALKLPGGEDRSFLVANLLRFGDSYAAEKRDLFRRVIETGDADLIASVIEDAPDTPEDLERLRPFLTHPDRGVAREAIDRIASLADEKYIPWLAGALQHAAREVRRDALTAIYRLGGDDSLSVILPLRNDPNEQVRMDLYLILGRSAAPEAADALVEGLRDEDSSVREVARASLKKIEEYYEHRRRWERLKDAFSVEDGSAEEALVRLAKNAKSKKGRIAAIRSLGTLAVPETLPFLIVLMEDEDEEIAGAAEEAVDRINSRETGAERSKRETE